MPVYRYFLDHPLKPQTDLIMEGEEAHHAIRVTKVRAGETIELVNGKNQLAAATVTKSDKSRAFLHIETVENVPAPARSVILAQAFCRFNRLDTILEKGTELGVTEFWLFTAAQSEKIFMSPSHQTRCQRICINAMKQCGRLDLPQIHLKDQLLSWEPDQFPKPAFFGDTSPTAPHFSTHETAEKNLLIFIGPESGFTPEEHHFLQKNGVQGVKLHHNILRVDTAAIVALGLVNY
jgi:16S rRNA (uracil1498-N3)-methyltransferase